MQELTRCPGPSFHCHYYYFHLLLLFITISLCRGCYWTIHCEWPVSYILFNKTFLVEYTSRRARQLCVWKEGLLGKSFALPNPQGLPPPGLWRRTEDDRMPTRGLPTNVQCSGFRSCAFCQQYLLTGTREWALMLITCHLLVEIKWFTEVAT